MATEEFKEATELLFDNYVSLHKKMSEKAGKDINLSFREYLDFYIAYEKAGIGEPSIDLDEYDYEEDDLDSSEEEYE